MQRRSFHLLPLLLLAAPLVRGAAAHPAGPVSAPAGRHSRTATLPLVFEPVAGHAAAGILFVARSRTGNLALRRDGLCFAGGPGRSGGRAFSPPWVDLHFTGTRSAATVAPLGPPSGTVNYVLGARPSAWRAGVPTYAAVRYRALYPGVDLVVRDADGAGEYDYHLAPGADPRAIRFTIGMESSRGHDQPGQTVTLNRSGDLIVSSGPDRYRSARPVAYQDLPRGRRLVPCRYVLLPGRNALDPPSVSFRLGAYDPRHPLVIDPAISYSTYLGGSAADSGSAAAVDENGFLYVTGTTSSTDFPTAFPRTGSAPPGANVFVAKLDPKGKRLVYSTYLGGADADAGRGIAVDRSGNAYVTGSTRSADFPLVPSGRGPLSSPGGMEDAFVVKLRPDGQVLYSARFGGSADDAANAIDLDPQGNLCVAGATASTDFPAVAALRGTNPGGVSAFVARISADGGSLSYSTYLGGAGTDRALALSVDRVSGRIGVAGTTDSPDFPAQSAAQPSLAGGTDGFVTVLNPAGNALVLSSYLGGTSSDEARALTWGANQGLWVAGDTQSADFPLRNPQQDRLQGASDAFVTHLSVPAGTLQSSTYLGGTGTEEGTGLAVDGAGTVYLVGATTSADLPLQEALQGFGGSTDGFLAQLDPNGQVERLTYIGGAADDRLDAVAVMAGHEPDRQQVFVTGTTTDTATSPLASRFPTHNAIQSSPGGAGDALVMRIDLGLKGRLAVPRRTVNFGRVAAGRNQPRYRKLKVLNTGSGVLMLTVSNPAPPFSVNPPAGIYYLAPHSGGFLVLGFRPDQAGSFTGGITLETPDKQRIPVQLTGKAR